MSSYANQKDVYSAKPVNVESPYIAIEEKDFYHACMSLKPSTVLVWIYLVKNRPDFKLEFSPKAVSNQMGLGTSTAKAAMRELEDKGYLIRIGGGTYQCLTRPNQEDASTNINLVQNLTYPSTNINLGLVQNLTYPSTNINLETTLHSNNTLSITKETGAKAPSEREERESEKKSATKVEKSPSRAESKSTKANTKLRTLDDLTDSELREIEDGFRNHTMKYKDIQSRYGLDWKYVNKGIAEECNSIRYRRASRDAAARVVESNDYVPTPPEDDFFEKETSFKGSRPSTNKFSDLW